MEPCRVLLLLLLLLMLQGHTGLFLHLGCVPRHVSSAEYCTLWVQLILGTVVVGQLDFGILFFLLKVLGGFSSSPTFTAAEYGSIYGVRASVSY